MRKFSLLLAVIILCSLAYADTIAYDTTKLIAGRFVKISASWLESGYFSQPGEKTRAKTLEDTLVAGWQSRSASIDVSTFNLSSSDADIYFAILNRHPELFYVTTYISYSYSTKITAFKPKYTTSDASEIANMQKQIDEAASNAISFIPDGASDLEKALILHDFIATHCDYKSNMTGTHIRDIYGVLVERTAVCAGYTNAYSYLLSKVGITSDYVSSEKLDHAWNLVTVNGVKYHVDVTWDDPILNDGREYKNNVLHKNFLRSDNGIKATKHSSWDEPSVYSSSDTRYDSYFWQDFTYPIPCCAGYAYPINSQGQLIKYNLQNGQAAATILTLSDQWDVWNEQSVYTDKYATSVLIGNDLFFNGPDCLYLYSLSNDTKHTLDIEYPAKQGYLYGLYQETPQTLQARITTTPQEPGIYCDLNPEYIHVASVSVAPASAILNVGQSPLALLATISPEDAFNQEITWTSSAPAIASVDSQGAVTPLAAGQALITAATVDGNKTAVCEITVLAPVADVTLSKTNATLELDSALKLDANVLPASATNKNVSWQSSEPAIASVDDAGLVTAHSLGQAVITVTTEDGNKTAQCTITVTQSKNVIVLVEGWNLIAFRAQPTKLQDFKKKHIMECDKNLVFRPSAIEAGNAYWLYSDSAGSLTFPATDFTEFPCQPTTAGSFIGISGDIPEWDLQTMTVYGWNGKEFVRVTDLSQLQPGLGYWVKLNQ